MKTRLISFFLSLVLLVACGPTARPTPEAESFVAIPTSTPTRPTMPERADTSTPLALPQRDTIIVTNTSDGGPGSLRQALIDVKDGDTITFDPIVFPPNAPATIYVNSEELVHIHVSNLTLDASNAGVILDGSQIRGDWVAGLQIVSSSGNRIMGLQISSFPGPGIAISGESRHNVIGGDRDVGVGPYGQGNLLSNNVIGVDLSTEGTTLNTITGNLIGTDAEGTEGLGNERDGISVTEGAHDNIIAPDNIIANNGSASPSSRPSTSGIAGSLDLQANDYPRVQIIARSSGELADNHIGVWFDDYGRYYDTDFVYTNGFKRIRLGSLAGEGQRWITIINAESLSDEVDQKITDYAHAGMEIVLVLASGSGIPFADGIFQTEEDFEQYVEFVGFVVSHFKGRIYAYEVWNEPGHMRPGIYADLVERVVPVIRDGDKEAKIIIGAIQGDWNNGYPGYGEFQRFTVDIDYLNELLQSGVVQMVDGISWHPFYDNIPNDPYYQEYPDLVQGIKDLATSNGFTGGYFADEIMWHTVDEENWDNGPPVSPLVAAKYYLRTITEHRGLGINVTINTFFQEPFMEPIHNICDSLAGAEPDPSTSSVESGDDTNLRQYAFALPDGDKLVSLWINDNAVEQDTGIEVTVTIPGVSVSKAIGIDVLYGFEQELDFEAVNGDLVIRDLLVRDYPLIIKLIVDAP